MLHVSAILDCHDQGVRISVKVGGTQEVPKHVGDCVPIVHTVQCM
jgi:hypothetical protein